MSRKFHLSLTKKLVFPYRIRNPFNHNVKLRQKQFMQVDDPTKDHNLKLQVKKLKTRACFAHASILFIQEIVHIYKQMTQISCLFAWVMRQIKAIKHKYAAATMTTFKSGIQLLMYDVQQSTFTSFLLLDTYAYSTASIALYFDN